MAPKMPAMRIRHSKPLLVSFLASSAVAALVPAAALAADTTPPVMAVPADVHYAQKTAGSVVRMTYTVGVFDDADAHPHVSCLPRSGSRFPLGTTKVTCTATDSSGNQARDSFNITVTAKSTPKHAVRSERVIPAAKRTTPRLTARAYRRTAEGIQLLGVKVQHAAKGAVVTVSCDRNCPAALSHPVTRTSRGSSVNLASLFARAHLQAGTTVSVTTAGSGVRTKTSRIIIRAGKPPVIR